MKLIALMPVRNEAWVLGLSARVALMWCDELVIGLHACTDASCEIAADLAKEHGSRVWPYFFAEKEWHEMAHRQFLLDRARDAGATHIAMIDADEILTGNLERASGNSINVALAKLSPGHLLQLPLYNLRGSIRGYHANGLWGNRIVSVAFADDPTLHWAGDRFHSREPQGKRLIGFQPIAHGAGGVMHLWGASERRLLAKHALYKITERLRWPAADVREIDRMYSMCVKDTAFLPIKPKDWTFRNVPDSWWSPYAHLMKYLDVDAEPWQEAEVRRLVAEHGREKFARLDLFGVA
jgi:hypothetical protein